MKDFKIASLKRYRWTQASFQFRQDGANHPQIIEASPVPDHGQHGALPEFGSDCGGAQ
jgi:hypothetical protein